MSRSNLDMIKPICHLLSLQFQHGQYDQQKLEMEWAKGPVLNNVTGRLGSDMVLLSRMPRQKAEFFSCMSTVKSTPHRIW